MEIVLASRNVKKIAEIDALLAPHGIRVLRASDFDLPDVVEDGETFADNSAKKARETASVVQRWTIGEDSGLMVDALAGRPGVYSARYAGDPCDDDRNNAKLIAELAGLPPEKRGAQYVCHVSVAGPTGVIRLQVEGRCRGRITEDGRGDNGFGYDPFFLIPEYHRTFGELSPAVKRRLSHRGRALEQLPQRLVRLLK
ncbi:MAG: RdgB/HAM1 family non-canonical purine NTP pyrophosphatase [Planctomycetaceae bacterium]